jgi:Ni/Co efflux regulator RcnB
MYPKDVLGRWACMNILTKRLLSTAAAAFLVAAPFAFTPASAQLIELRAETRLGSDQDRDRDWNQDRDRDWNCRDNRDDRCDNRREWRDTRDNARWDDHHHNGYYADNRWYYGPPPQQAYNQRNFYLGYHPWAAGQHLGYYNGRYTEVNYRAQNLKRPNRGHHWVRDDRGVYLLVSINSGRIRQVVNRNAR